MRHIGYADEMKATGLILAGLKANGARMSRWGYGSEFIAELEDHYRDLLKLGDEQQAIKARLKEKTAAIYDSMAVIQKLRNQARHSIKMEFPPVSWNEFGITDSK